MKSKNLLVTAAASLVLITSCQKEESPSTSLVNKAKKSEYIIFDPEGNEVSLESLPMTDPNDYSGAAVMLMSSYNPSANGHFSGFSSMWTIAGMNNKAGTHGQCTVNGLFNFNLETQFLAVKDNMAVFGAEITQVTGSVPFGDFDVGDYIYWAVMDNGERSNSALGKWAGFIVISFDGPSPFPPTFFFGLPSYYWLDAENQSDQIQVKD